MIIDSHVHLKHGDAAGTEYSAADIVRTMDAAGIDRSVVFAITCTARQSIDMAAAAAAQFPERLIPYAYALPSFEEPVLPLLEDAVRHRGFRGIKIHRGILALHAYLIDPVYALAGDLGVPCLVDFCGDLAAARRAVSSFPDTTFIIAHMGRFRSTNREEYHAYIDLAQKHENVILDASGVFLEWKIGEAASRLGASRIVFGTDGPDLTPDVVTHARRELRRIEELNLSDADKQAILGDNILRILKLEPVT